MNQTSELLFYFVCMESFRYTQACAGVPEEVFQMSYPEVDFLYLNEEDMVAAGVKDMAGCIDAMEEMFKLMKVGDYRMGGASDLIKNYADYVTDDVDEDGIYNALAHFGII